MIHNLIVQSQSIANYIDKSEDENEDYFIAKTSEDPFFELFCLSDGAGGAGIFNRDWAKFIASEVPIVLVPNFNWTNWFHTSATKFYDNVISQKDLSDLILSKKVYRDGSFSTLNACWLYKPDNSIYYTAIGDSCLFIFEKIENDYMLSISSTLLHQVTFDDPPKLLNWATDLQHPIKLKTKKLKNSFVLIMATDSLAKWILLNIAIIDFNLFCKLGFSEVLISSLNSGKYLLFKEAIRMGSGLDTIDSLLVFLEEISSNEELFTSELKKIHNQQEIEIDDYSLAVIKGNVSK